MPIIKSTQKKNVQVVGLTQQLSCVAVGMWALGLTADAPPLLSTAQEYGQVALSTSLYLFFLLFWMKW